MKKKLCIFLAAGLALSMTACSSPSQAETSAVNRGTVQQTAGSAQENTAENTAEFGADSAQAGSAGSGTESGSTEAAGEAAENSRTLIAYFSRWGNTDYPSDVDATTSASIVVDQGQQYGTTEYMARLIQAQTGGELHLIQTTDPYSTDFQEVVDQNHNEMDQDALPELKDSPLDMSAYDTVFIGYPIWATDAPRAVFSFLAENDLSGKTVIPFCTHDGYGSGGSFGNIGAEIPDAAAVLEGLAVEASQVPEAEAIVTQWLESIGVGGQRTEEQAEAGVLAEETAIKITVGDTVLDGVLYHTALAEEIQAQFPLTISAVGFGGREFYGGVDFYPKNLEGGQRTFENGHITYCEAHHNMAIFYAQTDNPNLSVDVIPIGKVTSDLGIFDGLSGNVEITFSLAE